VGDVHAQAVPAYHGLRRIQVPHPSAPHPRPHRGRRVRRPWGPSCPQRVLGPVGQDLGRMTLSTM
jgi:hypothetical protein